MQSTPCNLFLIMLNHLEVTEKAVNIKAYKKSGFLVALRRVHTKLRDLGSLK